MDLKALMLALDALRGACLAILEGHRYRASRCLAEATAASAKAFPLASREAYALTIILGAITEAAAVTS